MPEAKQSNLTNKGFAYNEISKLIKRLVNERMITVPTEFRSYVVNEQVKREIEDLKVLRRTLWKGLAP